MSVNVNEVLKKLSLERRKKIKARAAELIVEEMTLQQLRKALELTQARIAKKLGITQVSISRLEKQSDLLISTLRKTVRAMGGNLCLMAEFPGRPPVLLAGIADTPHRQGPYTAKELISEMNERRRRYKKSKNA